MAGSARRLDLYFWLTYRMSRIDTTTYISWEALADQFGQGYAQLRQFRAAFRKDLKAIADVFPELPADLSDVGIALNPASPARLALPRKK